MMTREVVLAVVEVLDSPGLMVCSGGEEVEEEAALLEYWVSALRLLDEKRVAEEAETAQAEAEAEAAVEVLDSSWRPTSAEIHVGYRDMSVG
jgi:hypothetical protein